MFHIYMRKTDNCLATIAEVTLGNLTVYMLALLQMNSLKGDLKFKEHRN